MKYGACFLFLIIGVAIFSSGCSDVFDNALGSAEAVACDGLSGSDRDHCYQDAAVRTGDSSLCQKIEYSPPKSKCYMRIAEKTANANYCQELMVYPGSSGEYSRLECYERVAVASRDPSYCDMMGTESVSMLSGVYNREECYLALGMEPATIQDIYRDNSDCFKYCYDIAYTLLHQEAPPSRSGTVDIAAEKNQLYDDLENAGYGQAGQGYVSEDTAGISFMDLQEGDIIMFDFESYPDPKNAPHYAVVQDGKIWQIVAWKQGGQLDGPRDPEFFFKPRTLTNPYTGETVTSPQVYHYYTVYRKSGE